MASEELSTILPRVVIVSRRCVRKNKFVDFVGEYHLDLIVRYGAVPVIVPRVAGVHLLLDSFEPIHGVLLCEGEDIDPSHYHHDQDPNLLTPADLDEVRLAHASDATIDPEKDSIELGLARLCLARSIPFLGICRGSQILNVACGGTLYRDVGKELGHYVKHVDYENYDGHRHAVRVVGGTPLREWFGEEEEEEIMVNSYHHQGVKRLAARFAAMAYSPDGLVEGFYDRESFDPSQGKFLMGLQFHPERMRLNGSDEFDYPGCPKAYQEFVRAVVSYQKKVNGEMNLKREIKVDVEMEKKRSVIVRSFSIAKDLYDRHDYTISNQSDLEPGADFLQSNTALSWQQEKRLKQMGATVRNSSSYLKKLKKNEEREAMARFVMGKMSAMQLADLLSFYRMMGQVCSEVMEKKLLTTSS